MILGVLASHLLIVFTIEGTTVRLWKLELSVIRGVFTPDIEGICITQNYISISLIGASLALGGQIALLISLFMIRLSLQQKWIKISLPFLWISVVLMGIGENLLEMIFQSLIFLFLSLILYILARQKRE